MTAKERFKKRRFTKRGLAEVILCPLSCMIDIVFLLLIYFVYTFQNVPIERFVSLQHPAPLPGEAPPSISRIECTVLPGKEYQFNNMTMPIKEIEGHLKRNSEAMDEVQLFIRVHPRAKQQELVDFLDICHKHKIKKINVLTLKE